MDIKIAHDKILKYEDNMKQYLFKICNYFQANPIVKPFDKPLNPRRLAQPAIDPKAALLNRPQTAATPK